MKPDVEEHLRSADKTLREMEHLMSGNFYRGVLGRAYRAMVYAATAAMLAREIKGGPRQAIVPAFAGAFIKTGLLDEKYHKYFSEAFATRSDSDQPSPLRADHRQAQTTIVRTRQFIAACRNLCRQADNAASREGSDA